MIGGKGGIQGGWGERERERNTWVREFKEVCQNVRESKEERERERAQIEAKIERDREVKIATAVDISAIGSV